MHKITKKHNEKEFDRAIENIYLADSAVIFYEYDGKIYTNVMNIDTLEEMEVMIDKGIYNMFHGDEQ